MYDAAADEGGDVICAVYGAVAVAAWWMVAVVVVSVSVVVASNEVDACAVVCSAASVTVEVGLAVRWDGSVEDIRADVCSLVACWLASAGVGDGGECCRACAVYDAAADESGNVVCAVYGALAVTAWRMVAVVVVSVSVVVADVEEDG